MVTGYKRIKILSEAEINDLYSLPKFTLEEKIVFFTLNRPRWSERVIPAMWCCILLYCLESRAVDKKFFLLYILTQSLSSHRLQRFLFILNSIPQ